MTVGSATACVNHNAGGREKEDVGSAMNLWIAYVYVLHDRIDLGFQMGGNENKRERKKVKQPQVTF